MVLLAGPNGWMIPAIDSGPYNLLTYRNGDEIWALRIGADGVALDPGGLQLGAGSKTLSNNQSVEAVASAAEADLLLFTDDRSGSTWTVRGALLAHRAGTIPDSAFDLGPGSAACAAVVRAAAPAFPCARSTLSRGQRR